MRYPKAIADYFVTEVALSGLSNGSYSELTGSYLTLPKGRYFIEFGGRVKITESVDPTRGLGGVALRDSSNGTIESAVQGIVEDGTTSWGCLVSSVYYLDTDGETIHLAGYASITGGTISNREAENCYIFAYKLN